eukprot:CAMPEP_0170454788 /NCGR_PEP_ID=MMETSP0123-20130129/2920_1 /TAXON_ID=182087 /ORGANISM="Favella ehrenbergii, Strain Fehren 1" /LENGTH=63 /DNA_ID=CAMNT_0010717611 /DNA_START=135 /DNA_END=326 /DNA_ORIENTATION=+
MKAHGNNFHVVDTNKNTLDHGGKFAGNFEVSKPSSSGNLKKLAEAVTVPPPKIGPSCAPMTPE